MTNPTITDQRFGTLFSQSNQFIVVLGIILIILFLSIDHNLVIEIGGSDGKGPISWVFTLKY